ncbi:hypothetical protein ISN44_As08g027660 [Arabidopsis suecica]|uniref:Uncharacterized protein n=1 Tax=Arabidopsis suecica TaxID=45249 RepID=A0A8T2B9N3_ARASU|nr:hypothetical protein ISN44_As08g027660 [Arabidopsis suecica]
MTPLSISASPSPPCPLLSPPLSSPSLNRPAPSIVSPFSRINHGFSCSFVSLQRFSLSRNTQRKTRNQLQVVAMAPEEEKLTRRNPLDFPIVSICFLQFLLEIAYRFVEISHCYCA